MAAVTDPIADMLTRIRNGIQARHARVDIPASKMKVSVASILRDEGYIAGFKVAEEGKKKVIRISLRYSVNGKNTISSLTRVSRPGRRVYVGVDQIPRILGGMGVAILTTPNGLMTGKNAKKAGIGGELLCTIS
ncbi:MAG TPA: 30S ribosomal protein S8 [Terriglobia bacterium]|nr:30S ribosomal protein S8 [Terriglobia bacterium]